MGIKAVKPYRYIFTLFVLVGALAELETVWSIADLFNALMAFPNLIGLLVLTPVVVKVTKEYFDDRISDQNRDMM
jgi:AGCS family alanine or glycine:cation symporter